MGTPGQGKEVPVYSKTSTVVLGPNQPSLQLTAAFILGLKRSGREVAYRNRVDLHVTHTGTAYSRTRDSSTNICVFVTSTESLSAANGYTNPMTFIAGVRSNRCDANCYCPRQLAAFHKHHNGG